MKSKIKIISLVLSLGAMTTFISCSNDDDDCPDQSFNSFEDCEDATDGKKCICIKEGGEWKAVLNP